MEHNLINDTVSPAHSNCDSHTATCILRAMSVHSPHVYISYGITDFFLCHIHPVIVPNAIVDWWRSQKYHSITHIRKFIHTHWSELICGSGSATPSMIHHNAKVSVCVCICERPVHATHPKVCNLWALWRIDTRPTTGSASTHTHAGPNDEVYPPAESGNSSQQKKAHTRRNTIIC